MKLKKKLKIILILFFLLVIVLLALFGAEVKEKAINSIAGETSDYNCQGDFCATCHLEGQKCSCGKSEICSCGNMSVEKKECELF